MRKLLSPFARHREFGVALALGLVILGFSLSSSNFLTLDTWGSVLTVSAELGIVAVGVTLLMISNEYDLSVGSNFALSAMLMVTLMEKLRWPSSLALLAALTCGALIGLANGWVTLKAGIPSFITTLGTMMFWRGAVLAFTGGWPISLSEPTRTTRLLGAALGEHGFNMSNLWWLAASAALVFVLGRTRYGNWTFATGGKMQAARALGVPVERVKLINFTLVGLLAALGGVLQFCRLESMSPNYGTLLELEAIAASVIGGTSLFGGSGTVLGTLLGTLLMGTLSTGLVLAGAPVYWYRSFIGVIIILAVIINLKAGAYFRAAKR